MGKFTIKPNGDIEIDGTLDEAAAFLEKVRPLMGGPRQLLAGNGPRDALTHPPPNGQQARPTTLPVHGDLVSFEEDKRLAAEVDRLFTTSRVEVAILGRKDYRHGVKDLSIEILGYQLPNRRVDKKQSGALRLAVGRVDAARKKIAKERKVTFLQGRKGHGTEYHVQAQKEVLVKT